MRYTFLLLVVLLGSCGGTVDEDTLRAQVREEVRAELRAEREAEQGRRNEAVHQEQGEANAAAPLDLTDVVRFRVDAGTGPRRGANDPVVTIVEFTDYECPFCQRVQPTLARLLNEFPNDVQLVFRNNPLPFHQRATPAAHAALEAYAQGGDPLFWRMHDVLFENRSALERTDLMRYATALGMDSGLLANALDTHRHQPRVAADQQIAAQLGARGTPAFFINGIQLMGAQPYAEFETLVRQEIRVAGALMERGVRRADVYARLQRGARTEPVPRPERPDVAARPQPDPLAVYRVPVAGRPELGSSDALITLVLFSDFQCPFCARVQPTIDHLRTTFGSDLRVIHRHNPLPFHQNAMPAAEVAEEVFTRRGSAAFFRFAELCYTNQSALEEADLIRYAAQVGVRARAVRAALADHRHRAAITTDQELARSLGASGTPAFFLNGRNLRGAQPYPAFETLINELLPVARARVANGTRAADVYEALTSSGATSPQLVPGAAPTPTPPRPPADQVYTIPVPAHAPTRGPASAPVTIQIFSDFQCPFCNRVRPTIEQVVSHYGNQVRLVWRDYPLPFHEAAMPAAEAAREVFAQAGDGAFWQYNNLLFENQRDLDEEVLVRLAGSVPGVNPSGVRAALSDHRHRSTIDADVRSIGDAGARIGTPSVFINGRLLQGAQPFGAFQAAIDRALSGP